MEGYVQLLLGILFITFLYWAGRAKKAAFDREHKEFDTFADEICNRSLNKLPTRLMLKDRPKGQSFVNKIAYCQAWLRLILTLLFLLAIGLLVVVAISAAAWRIFGIWDFSFSHAESGYHAAAIIVLNLLKLVVSLSALYYITIGIVILGTGMVYYFYLYLALGSIIQIPFIFHFIMTWDYIPPSFPEIVLPILAIMGIFNFLLSDAGDFTVFILGGIAEKTG